MHIRNDDKRFVENPNITHIIVDFPENKISTFIIVNNIFSYQNSLLYFNM